MSTEAEIRTELDTSLVEVLAGVFGIGLTIYDKNDILLVASREMSNFFPATAHEMVPGVRLRDILGAVYDTNCFKPVGSSSLTGLASRDDWIAERLAMHWRERFESIERLSDGRFVRMVKRRMPTGMLISTVTDVSEVTKRDLEVAELRKQAELFQQTLANMANPVMVKDASLRYVFVNDAFCQMLGLHSRKLVGRTASDIADPATAEHYEQNERQVLETGVPVACVEDVLRADGSIVRSITRKSRFGSPGNYRLLVMIDAISTVGHADQIADDTSPVDGSGRRPPASSRRQTNVLVLDANRCRATASVAALRARGSDAFAVHTAAEGLAFLDAATSMGVVVNAVQSSSAIADELVGMDAAKAHPVLVRYFADARMPEPGVVTTKGAIQPSTEKAIAGHLSAAPAKATEMPAADQPGSAVTIVDMPSSLPPAAIVPTPQPVVPEAPATTVEPAPAPARSKSRRIRVLVAEDNEVNQIVFEQILEGVGVDYRIVDNGQLALDAWRAACPDIILMDVSMPVMNGLQATQAIRAAEIEAGGNESHVPIIAVTAHAMSGDRDRCFAAGMDDYLSKPVSPEKLEAAIRTWIDNPDLIPARAGYA